MVRLALAGWLLGVGCHVQAQSLIWDSDTTTNGAQDGGGTWDANSHPNWLPDASSSANTVWPADGSSTIALFGNSSSGTTPGTITVSGTVNAAGLVFQPLSTGVTTAYTFSGGTIALTNGSVIEIQGTAASSTSGFLNLNSNVTGSNLTIRKTGGSVAYIQLGTGAKNWTGALTFDSGDGDIFFRVSAAANVNTLSSLVVVPNTTVALTVANVTLTPDFSIAGTGSTTRGALRFDSNNTTVAGNISLSADAMILMNAASISDTISGGINLNSSSLTLQTISAASNSVLNVNGTVSGTGGLIVGSSGAGTGGNVNLNGNNTFTGGLTINAGQVILGNDGALNSSTPQDIFFGSANAKTLTLNGHSVAVSTLQINSGGSNVTVQNGAATDATLTLTGTGITFAGTLADGSGGGKLSLTYNATTTTSRYALSGTNTFTGNVTLTQGTLIARGNNSALGSGTLVTEAAGAHLELDGVTITGKTFIGSYLQAALYSSNDGTWTGNVQSADDSNSLTFAASQATTQTLTVNGNVNATSANGTISDVNAVGQGIVVINGSITNARRIIANGSGMLVLNGANTFSTASLGGASYGLSIYGGTVRLGNANALGDITPGQFNLVTFHSGNTVPEILQVYGVDATARALFSGGSAANTIVENGSATDATLTLKNADNRSFNGTIQDGTGGGKLGLTLSGGSQTLFGASTYSGATTINAGGTLYLAFNGADSVVTAPQNNILNNTANNSTLVLGGGTLQLTGASNVNNSQQFNGLVVDGGNSTIKLANGTSNDLLLSLGAITHNAGTVNFVLPTGAVSNTNAITTTTANNASGILGGWATVNGTDWAANDGSGHIVAYTGYTDVTNYSTGTGAQGPIPNNANANVRIIDGGTSGHVQLANPTLNSINSLLVQAAGPTIIDVPAYLDTLQVNSEGGIMLVAGAGTLDIGDPDVSNTGGTLTAISGNGTSASLMVTNYSTNAITVNVDINDNGAEAVSLVMNGTGNLILKSTFSGYSGGTYFNGGTVQAAADLSLGVDPSSVDADNLTFNGGTLQWGSSSFNLNSNRGITLLAGGGTLDTQGFSTTYSGVITGAGSLTKNGTGALTLNTANTYTGNTIANSGVIVVGNNQALGSTSGSTVVNSNGRVTLANGVTVTGETITINGTGGNAGGSATTGTIGNANNGALQVAPNATATWRGDVLIGSNSARLGGNNSSLLIIDGVIRNGGVNADQGNLAISTAGAGGIVRVSQKAAYTGSTQIVRGTLQLGTENALPTTTALQLSIASSVTELIAFDLNGYNQTIAELSSGPVVAGMLLNVLNSSGTAATLTVNTTTTKTYDGALTGNLALVKDGTGSLTLTSSLAASSGDNDYTGKTTVAGGTLALSGSGSLTATPWIQVNSGAIFDVSARTGGGYTVTTPVVTGSGSVNGTLTVSGNSSVRPGTNTAGTALANAGNTIGTLTFQNLTLTAIQGGDTTNNRLLLQLAGSNSNINDPLAAGNASYFSTAASDGLYDSIKVTGTLGLNAGSTIRLEMASGAMLQYGEVFNLLDWSTLNTSAGGGSAFTVSDLDTSGLSSALAAGGWYLDTTYFLSDGVVYVAPEPSKSLLLLLGACWFVSRRRRRARS